MEKQYLRRALSELQNTLRESKLLLPIDRSDQQQLQASVQTGIYQRGYTAKSGFYDEQIDQIHPV